MTIRLRVGIQSSKHAIVKPERAQAVDSLMVCDADVEAEGCQASDPAHVLCGDQQRAPLL